EDVDLKRTISIRAHNDKIEDILNQIFGNTNTTFNIYDRRIYLVRKKVISIPKPRNLGIYAPILQDIIKGTITDQDGTPLPGANVVVKGTNNGVTADFDGNFSISIDSKNAVLVVSY